MNKNKIGLSCKKCVQTLRIENITPLAQQLGIIRKMTGILHLDEQGLPFLTLDNKFN